MKKLGLSGLILIISLGVQSQFSTQIPLSQSGGGGHCITAADLDGDGDSDLLYSGSGSFVGCSWRKNFGNGDYGPQQKISHSSGNATDVRAVDLDADGDIDVLTSSNDDHKIAWYENFGDGSFGQPVIISVQAFQARCVRTGDLDNDGDLDVISASFQDNKIAWYENLGNTIFGPQQIISTLAVGAEAVRVVDLDGDGDLDLVSASSTDNKIAFYVNSGTGSFGPQQVITTLANGISYEMNVHVLDLDNDGDLDILSASYSDDKIAWYENLGGNTFGPQQILSAVADGAQCVLTADLDGDSDPDIISASSDDGKIAWHENLGGGLFSGQQIIIVSANVQSIYPCDMNNDGIVDLISITIATGISVHENTGNANFVAPNLITHKTQSARAVITADLDGDGDGDIVTASSGDDKIAWVENLGGGKYGDQKVISTTVNIALTVHASDLDGDGDLDILTASNGDNLILWFENLGNGDFGSQQTISSLPDLPTSVYSEDLDGDGDMDVLSASWDDDRISWFKNLGGGTFGPMIVITNLADKAEDVFAIDLDGDSDVDVISASSWDGELAWYQNSGTGTFGPQQIILDDVQCYSTYAIDLDQDGDNDILSAWANKIIWHENSGVGSFTTHIISAASVALSIYAQDLDDDGDLDVLLATQTNDKIAWHENTGNCIFGPAQSLTATYFIADAASSVFADDLDNDGDMDVLSSSEQDSKIALYENLLYDPLQLRGQVFIDYDENGMRDVGDEGIYLAEILTNPQTAFTFSEIDGKYAVQFVDVVTGSYQIYPQDLPYWYLTSDSALYNVQILPSFSVIDSLDFGFCFDTLVDILTPELVGGYPKCNTIINYWLNFQNTGTTHPSGVIHLELDNEITYISSSFIPDSTSGQHIYWSYDSLEYFSFSTIDILVEMPDFTSLGDTLNSYLEAIVIDSLGNTSSSIDSLLQVLTCAYDPNDKIKHTKRNR
ncbi:MAG: VCBS repeat-containing protein [Crocinitomicaceae bacterium]|nr:VCBS repeat-containing protein [Crocinitomicaceae bacterium]